MVSSPILLAPWIVGTGRPPRRAVYGPCPPQAVLGPTFTSRCCTQVDRIRLRTRPVGTNDNSPAIYRWVERRRNIHASPVGTAETVTNRSGDSIDRPYRTQFAHLDHLAPTSELVGYSRPSLRDKKMCVTTWRKRRVPRAARPPAQTSDPPAASGGGRVAAATAMNCGSALDNPC